MSVTVGGDVPASVEVVLARLEGKVDVALTQQGARIEQVQSEQLLQRESGAKVESRVGAIERGMSDVITRAQAWRFSTGAVAVAVGVVTLWEKLGGVS